MGLFGSSTITTVGTQVLRVLEDKRIPDSIATGTAKNLYSGDDQMVEYVMEEMSQSIGLRAQRMHNFGARTYMYGLPSSTLKTSSAARDVTRAAIQAQVGSPVEMAYYHFGPFNEMHYAWQQLVNVYGYNSGTNTLTVAGKEVYLKDMQLIVKEATLTERANGSLDQWGPAPNSGKVPQGLLDGISLAFLTKPTGFAVDGAAAQDYILVTYCWEEVVPTVVQSITINRKVVKQDTLQFNVGDYDVHGDYHQASYILAGRLYYWTYKDQSGLNPSIDTAFQTSHKADGKFFPILYFRYAKQSTNNDKTSQAFKESKKLAGYLGMDFDALADSINENPDIADVEQAMMMMAVPASTDDPMERRYLFDFFSNVYTAIIPTPAGTILPPAGFAAARILGVTGDSASCIIEDKRFKMALSYKTVVNRLIAGKVCKVGEYSSGFYTTPIDREVDVLDGGKTTWNTTDKYHAYYHQITEDVYREIRVYGLTMKYWIFENYTTTGDEGDDILLIPLDQDITKHYSIADKEVLYSRSMHYIFNSRVVTKLKWYQTGVFRIVMIIIAVIVAFYTYGSTSGALAGLLGGEAASEYAISAIVYRLVIAIVINKAIQIFIRVLGTRFAALAAILVAVAAIYQIATGNAATSLPSGDQLLAASSTMSQNIVREVGMEQQDLMNDVKEFELYVKHQDKLLQDAQALLNTGLRVDPVVIFGETPTDFYQRTVHYGNIGPIGIEAVTSFVEVSLQLPKLPDTLGAMA